MTANVMSWAVTYLMHSTLLIAAVWVGARWVRSAAVRDTLWKVALVGGLVTASVQVAMPVRVWSAAPTPALLIATAETVNVDATPARVAQEAVRDAAPVKERPSVPPQSRWGLVWTTIAALLVIRLLYGRHRLLSILSDRKEIVAGGDRALLDSLGTPRLVRLTESTAIRSPMAMVGWEIVIPRGIFERLSDEQRRTILAHEVAHLVRRDPLWLACAEVLKAILFFQPLNFVAAAKIKETAEFLCDDAAVMQTGDRQALAETLAELASSVVPMPTSVAAMAEGGSNLIVRVTRVLRSHGVPELPLRMHRRMGLALVPLALVALFAPGVAPALAPALAPVAATPPVVKAATATVVPPKHEDGGKFNHFTDGHLVHTYEGREGFTRIEMTAKNAAIALNGAWVRFDDAAGFFRVRYTSKRGEERRVDVVPGANLAPVYRYTVGGRAQAWSTDARRLMVAAFRSRELEEVGVEGIALDENAPARKLSEWNADVEEEGHRDGVPLRIRVRIDSVFYDAGTGEIDFARSGSLFAEEVFGDRTRSVQLEDGRAHLAGDWEGTSRGERQEWISRLLRRHTTGGSKVIRNIQMLVP